MFKSGWTSNLEEFVHSSTDEIISGLKNFVDNYSQSQINAWEESIKILQQEAFKIIKENPEFGKYFIILEYLLNYEYRRPDCIILTESQIFVIEFKSSSNIINSDIDQVSAYARDLKAYHRECQKLPVLPILVPINFKNISTNKNGVIVTEPNSLAKTILINEIKNSPKKYISLEDFFSDDSYNPLPTLVEAARELFFSRKIREIWRARASTDPAVKNITDITEEAARNHTRHLILISGIPGSGKTLTGMRAVHNPILDKLAVPRNNNKPTVPGLYLTGNLPLSEVLQYELSKAGGGGRTFVRHIKSYLDRYISRSDLIPFEHVLVFDEAQRAFSKEKVSDTHKNWNYNMIASEPELFIRICDRMPDWGVMIGLIGGGQEIHLGEEEGLIQWKNAISGSDFEWIIHCPEELSDIFDGKQNKTIYNSNLNLSSEIRFHLIDQFYEYIELILEGNKQNIAKKLSKELIQPSGNEFDGIKLYITRNLDVAKNYLTLRYEDSPLAKYGIIASSRDKSLPSFGIDNSFQATRNLKRGPWFTESKEHSLSSTQFKQVATEFDCQGLELDMSLLAWGSDLIIENNKWTNLYASRYSPRGSVQPKDPFQMRLNAYRVLLTRGRDGVIIFVPENELLDNTYNYFIDCGFEKLC